jgi:hypothetical protein
MSNGFFKVYNFMMESKFYQDHKAAAMLLWLSYKASYTKKTEFFNGCSVQLQPGDIVTSLSIIENELKVTQRNARTCLKKLKKLKILTIKTTKKYTLISLINPDTYIDPGIVNDKQNDKQVTKKRQRGDKQGDKQVTHSIYNKTEDIRKNTEDNTPLNPPKGKPKKPNLLGYLKRKIVEEQLTDYQPLIIEFYEYRMAMKAKDKYKTEKGVNGLFRDMKGCLDIGYNLEHCLEIAMEKEWKTPSPVYFKNFFANNTFSNNPKINNLPQRSRRNLQACLDFVENKTREMESERNGFS